MKIIAAAAALALAFAGPALAQSAPPASTGPIPGGAYTLDKSHASLLFRVDHLGFSKWTARFTRFDAKLQFDPKRPAAATLEATVDPASLDVDNAPDGFVAELRGKDWLDSKQYPQLTYRSTKVTVTGPNRARIDGLLTLHGVTKPVALNAVYNGGYAGHPMDPNARIGFSATGVLKRSEFGIAYGVPAPGTKLGVSDAVDIVLEAEFSGPAWTAPTAAARAR